MSDDTWQDRVEEIEDDVLAGYANSQTMSRREQVRTALSNWADAIPDQLSGLVDLLTVGVGIALLQSSSASLTAGLPLAVYFAGAVLTVIGALGIIQSLWVRLR